MNRESNSDAKHRRTNMPYNLRSCKVKSKGPNHCLENPGPSKKTADFTVFIEDVDFSKYKTAEEFIRSDISQQRWKECVAWWNKQKFRF